MDVDHTPSCVIHQFLDEPALPPCQQQVRCDSGPFACFFEGFPVASNVKSFRCT